MLFRSTGIQIPVRVGMGCESVMWQRNVRGLVTEVIDPVGNVTTVEYSPEGWVTRVVNPDGSERSGTYDGEGNLTQTVNETGATTTTRYTVFDKSKRRHLAEWWRDLLHV